jgi:hypothetical protein
MSTDLALTRPDASLTMDTLRAQMEAAKRYVDSGLLPSGIRTPQQALTIMQVGREVGVPATYALRNIHVIQGKPACSAELLMALVRRTYGQAAIRVREATNESCTVEYREAGWDGISSLTFTMDDAKKAKLHTKDMWQAYPRAMLRARAVSEAVRTAFPECLAGLYTPEELGAEVRVTPDGTVEIATVTEPSEEPTVARIGGSGPLPGRSSPQQVDAWLHRWFGMVKGTSLGSDAARATFVKQWTKDWPASRQTDSLRHMLSRMTEEQATDMLDHVEAAVDAERTDRQVRLEATAANADDFLDDGATVS